MSPIRAWLTEFLFIRDVFREPPGLPLYRYQVTPGEYRELEQILRDHRMHAIHQTYGLSWAGAFCLFVAESFRREYDAKDGGWAWARFENRLNCKFTPQQHGELVRQGLIHYWKRPIRQYLNGRDNLLGSLFTEGGLPWPLVQSDSHGFGRVVRKGLKYYYRTEGGLRTTADVLADFEQELPQTFRTLETRQLLAGIVEQLMFLATQYELRGKTDPAQYLDEVTPHWWRDFPLPLDEDNARRLISEWLRDASRRRAEREAERAEVGAFSCAHRLVEQPHGWRIRTEVTIPCDAQFLVDSLVANTTRYELAFFEGDRLLARAGTAYGHQSGGQPGLSVRFLRTQISIDRSRPCDELTLRLLANGRSAYTVRFEQGALDEQELPLVFECRGDEWWFIASASCSTTSGRVRVHLPERFSYSCDGTVSVQKCADNTLWLETSDSLQLTSDTGDCYTIRLRTTQQQTSQLALKGNVAHFVSVPQVVYLGWPRLDTSIDAGESQARILEVANRRPLTRVNGGEPLGGIRYIARTGLGEVLLQRRFGVVPAGFAIQAFPASPSKPARLVLKNARPLDLQVIDSTIKSRVEVVDQDTTITLEPLGNDPPSFLTLETRGRTNPGSDPIQFRLAYPYQGARLLGSDGTAISQHNFTLTELLGLRVALATSASNGTEFCLRLELASREGRCARHYFVRAGNTPALLSLFSYQADMLQMLGAVDDQDAYLRVTVETNQPLLRFDVRRYNGAVRWEDKDTFSLTNPSGGSLHTEVAVEAMLLTDPKQASVEIPEMTSEGAGTGRFRTVLSMRRDGPWLIYPATGSSTQFRPVLYVPEQSSGADIPAEIRSLHTAARVFHPISQPDVINRQIADMATDLDHSGWQYLADLRQHFRHLPLSVFESWLALSRNPAALATAVFRLEFDEAFCERIRDELAVIWECIPLPGWATAYARFREWLVRQGVPEVLLISLLKNRRAMLPAVVSGFKEVGNYLETADPTSLPKLPVEIILPGWYQQLRRTHEGNNRWPTDLGFPLKEWIRKQPLPNQINNLSMVEFSDAVTYLPIFMAYVTAGMAHIEDLKERRSYVKFVIKMVSDFDRSSWYTPVHGMMVSYLLASAPARGSE
ncbi:MULTISPECIES: STY4851/ECs_5259 family protein [Paraburkholderia]|uniref:STY4851/ECs_5259 family protein n=1 Tax=Paraburkholderia TaxID=1822464 RepID=UPI0022557050|nr:MULTISPECIES: STY4851/ECs_5259 family protein [Paraburkholderia]MCX4177661.1 STY4851/ECs_5259 family protein [Paraburkholderia madseniana]MDQ6465650.1 STY4851/ECs_5259 family protein [Paraburkholderia madseniana]